MRNRHLPGLKWSPYRLLTNYQRKNMAKKWNKTLTELLKLCHSWETDTTFPDVTPRERHISTPVVLGWEHITQSNQKSDKHKMKGSSTCHSCLKTCSLSTVFRIKCKPLKMAFKTLHDSHSNPSMATAHTPFLSQLCCLSHALYLSQHFLNSKMQLTDGLLN